MAASYFHVGPDGSRVPYCGDVNQLLATAEASGQPAVRLPAIAASQMEFEVPAAACTITATTAATRHHHRPRCRSSLRLQVRKCADRC